MVLYGIGEFRVWLEERRIDPLQGRARVRYWRRVTARDELTFNSSFLPHRIEACSSALTTLMYESCSVVYLPTRTI
jgi:hypothetical protein